MVTQREILELNKKVQIPLFLTFLGAKPKTVYQLGRKPDYRCPAWFRGGDNPNGLGVTYNFDRKKWLCTDFTGKTFSNIDLIDFATKVMRKSFNETLDLMVFCSGKDNGFDDKHIPIEFEEDTILEEPKKIDPSIMNTFKLGLHPYWQKEGYTPEIARRFKLGWCNNGELKDRLTIPVKDENGDLVAVQGRSMDDRIEPKYRFLSGTGESAKLTLYNFDDAIFEAHDRGWIGVVESAKSVWRANQYNFLNFVATLSTSATDRQVKLLAESGANVVIMFDFDATETMGGQIGAMKLANGLKEYGCQGEVWIPNIGFHASPDELTLDQFVMTLKNAKRFC